MSRNKTERSIENVLTPKQKKYIDDHYASDTTSEISNHLSITYDSVFRYCNRMGYKRKLLSVRNKKLVDKEFFDPDELPDWITGFKST